jgi:hypothetical protein
MRKWDDFREIYRNFVSENLTKISRKFREDEKSIKFDSDTACMVHLILGG